MYIYTVLNIITLMYIYTYVKVYSILQYCAYILQYSSVLFSTDSPLRSQRTSLCIFLFQYCQAFFQRGEFPGLLSKSAGVPPNPFTLQLKSGKCSSQNMNRKNFGAPSSKKLDLQKFKKVLRDREISAYCDIMSVLTILVLTLF